MVTIDLRTPANEDWIKFRTWDLAEVQTLEDVFQFLRDSGVLPEKSTVEEEEALLKKFIALPSYNAAPKGLKEGIARWLGAVMLPSHLDSDVHLGDSDAHGAEVIS